MIRQLVGALDDAGVEIDAEAIADALWLARVKREDPGAGDQRSAVAGPPAPAGSRPPAAEPPDEPGDARSEREREPARSVAPRQASHGLGAGASSITLAKVQALPGTLELGRALRPLKQRYPSKRRRSLNADATVQYFCDTGILTPIMRPGGERWFDVEVLFDAAPSMAVWRDLVAEFVSFLQRHGAFREVRRWNVGQVGQTVRLTRAADVRSEAAQLVNPDARQLIMIVTDGIAPMWYQAPIWDAIRGWGLFSPVVVISPLPARLWPGTALGSPEVTMRSHRPGAANRILDVTLPWWWPEDEPPWPAVPVPVITLEAGQVAGWARMAMGAGGAESLGMFAMPPPGRTGASPGLARPDAEERVRRFRVTVSPAACRLAVALSAVLRGPWQLGLARVVQKAVHPGSGPVQLAEVLIGGLVRQVERPADQEEPVFEFVDGVADVLQRSMTGTEALRVLEALSGYIERETGESPGIAALLLGETAPAGATEEFGEIRAGAANLIQAMGLALPPAAPGPSAEAPGASDPGEPRPQPRRVVQVIGLVDGRRQVGSGYRVAGRFVLTAAHCVRGATEQRVRLEDGEQPAQVVVDGTPDVDLALLEIVPGQTEYGPVAEVPPIRCARVDRDSSGQIECVASGFPQYAARADTPAPVQQVKGRISAAKAPPVWRLRRRRDQAGLLTVTVAGTTPYPLPTSETELSQSAWAGMSGAAVLAHGSLVGVVTENHLPNDGGSLTVAPIEWVERLDSADRARLLAALGLTSTSEIYLLRTDLAVPVDPERDHVRGPAEAAVTLVEYGDYEALYCGAAEPAIREVLAGHADLCLVWRHLPLTEVHPHAQLAAEAAEAAARQGMFWPMHDRLLDHQDALTADDLIRYAAELGLDTGRFTADLRSRAGEAKIADDVDSADLSGVTGVPTFLINGRRHYGAYNTDALTKAVRAAGARPLARSAPPRTAQPYDVRVMPDVSPPGVVSIRDIGQQTIQREAAGTALEMSSRSTALDLLLGPGTDAVEALAGQILSAGGPQSLGRSLVQFPELTREVAAREVATTAAALLAVDLIGLLVAGWREHRDIVAAGRRTLAAAGSTELVSMSSHEITVDQRPSVSVLVDGHRIHDLQFGFSIMFNVSGLSLGISGGRLVAVNPGNCDVTATLTLQDTVFLTRSARLEVTSDISSGGEILLLPMGEYPPTATRFWELLNPAERESLRAVGIWRTFEAGATIMQQGELADHVLVVLGGQAEILVEENGNERVVAVRGPGELIGERSALAVSERSATVVALEMVWALVVQGEDFAAFISAHPRILQITEDQVRQRLATERPAGDDNDPANSPAGYSSNRPRGPYEGNCTVVIADVIDFGARNRTDSDIRLIREALFTMMENAIRDVPGARSVDRGDGFLTVVPPSVPPAEVLDRLLREFPAVLERHNGTVSESARFRLRLAVNVGPVAILEDEVSGEAISVAARLVDAAAFKSAVAAGPASFGVIVSPFVYETAVRPRPDRAEVASYSQVSVRMKGSSTPAWVRLIR